MKKLSLILLFSLGALSAFAQQRITLDLQQTIALANDSSLEAFRTKNMYLPVIGNTAPIRQTAFPA